jgi:hypothetical protein
MLCAAAMSGLEQGLQASTKRTTSGKDSRNGKLQKTQQKQSCTRSTKPEGGDDASEAAGKGPIALLQEFVQCSRAYPLPPNCSALQWTHDNRMASKAALEYRATVAFYLEGVPHHAAGTWQASKKRAQRDTAHRVLSLFVGRWGEQLLRFQPDDTSAPNLGCSTMVGMAYEQQILELYCAQLQACTGPLQWSLEHEGDFKECFAVVELPLLGVPHKLAGTSKGTEEEAFVDVACRALWYLQCPGFEKTYQPECIASSKVAQDMAGPTSDWLLDDSSQESIDEANRKTVVMRAQNRLQQLFSNQLQAHEGVLDWSYETDPKDNEWPPLFRATAHVPVVGKSFAGDWARGQRDAQIEAIAQVNSFLDDMAGVESQHAER